MSILCSLIRVSPARLEALQESLDLWKDMDSEMDDLSIAGWYGEERPGIPYGECDLNSYWDVLRFILDPARRASALDEPPVTTPEAAAIAGWRTLPMSYADWFDSVPRFNSSEEVVAIARALDEIEFDAVKEECDAALLDAIVYRFEKSEGFAPFDWAYLRDMFGQVKAFYELAAAKGQAVIVYTD